MCLLIQMVGTTTSIENSKLVMYPSMSICAVRTVDFEDYMQVINHSLLLQCIFLGTKLYYFQWPAISDENYSDEPDTLNPTLKEILLQVQYYSYINASRCIIDVYILFNPQKSCINLCLHMYHCHDTFSGLESARI